MKKKGEYYGREAKRENNHLDVISCGKPLRGGHDLSAYYFFGDGSQTRSFCYISDLIEGIYKLMLSDINEPVNLGNPEEMTILQLAGKILEITGSKSEIVYKPLPEDDPKVRRPDITRAQKALNWQPKVSLEEGLEKSIQWFKGRA